MSEHPRRFFLDGTMTRGGGGFTYLANVVPRLAHRAPHDRFRLLTRSESLAEEIRGPSNLEVDLLPPAGLRERFRFSYLKAPGLARAWGADLYYSAGEAVPMWSPCPVIASLQNPNVFNSEHHRWPLRQRLRLGMLRWVARLSASRAARVLFVSEDSASWMGDALGLPAEKRAWLHHGVDADAWRSGETRSPGESYILSVSDVYRYKNFVRLIEAYAHLAGECPDAPDLLIVGEDLDAPYMRRMEEARKATGDLAERIHFRGRVPHHEIRAYYQGAALFVFPSYLETFGIPMIEAMAAGIPVVASDIGVFREVGGDAPCYVDPHDPLALAGAMGELLRSEPARRAMAKRGLERVRRFTWDATADRLLNVFESVLLEHRPRERAADLRGYLGMAPAGAHVGPVGHHAGFRMERR